MDGLLIIDKPGGPTSHDVVSRMRRLLRERRIGHTGTLDPAATGVLLLVVGRATRPAAPGVPVSPKVPAVRHSVSGGGKPSRYEPDLPNSPVLPAPTSVTV